MPVSSYASTVLVFALVFLIFPGLNHLINRYIRSKKLNTLARVFNVLFAFLMTAFLMALSPYIEESTEKMIFRFGADGEVNVTLSPLKVPVNKNDSFASTYCKQFSDEDGQPISGVYVTPKGTYCVYFSDLYAKEVVTVPYKILSNGKAEYWLNSRKRVIGPPPVVNKK